MLQYSTKLRIGSDKDNQANFCLPASLHFITYIFAISSGDTPIDLCQRPTKQILNHTRETLTPGKRTRERPSQYIARASLALLRPPSYFFSFFPKNPEPFDDCVLSDELALPVALGVAKKSTKHDSLLRPGSRAIAFRIYGEKENQSHTLRKKTYI